MLLVSPASAQLTLHLDTANQQLWFTGSATGTPTLAASDGPTDYYQVDWGTTTMQPSESGQGVETLYAFSFSSSNAATPIGIGLAIDFEAPPSNNFRFVTAWSGDPGLTTLTGTGQIGSYAELSNGNIALLESFAGAAFSSASGQNFSPLSVQLSAVPEPSTYAAFAGLGVLGFAAWRRQRRRVNA